MAARRLIIVLVVLLAISIVAAAIAPDRRSSLFRDDEETTEAREDPRPAGEAPAWAGSEAVSRTIGASPESPQTVRVSPGDQLSLTVEVSEDAEVQIDPLGLIESASPDDPAVFDLLLREPGDLAVRSDDGGEVVGRILVAGDERPAGDGSMVP